MEDERHVASHLIAWLTAIQSSDVIVAILEQPATSWPPFPHRHLREASQAVPDEKNHLTHP